MLYRNGKDRLKRVYGYRKAHTKHLLYKKHAASNQLAIYLDYLDWISEGDVVY